MALFYPPVPPPFHFLQVVLCKYVSVSRGCNGSGTEWNGQNRGERAGGRYSRRESTARKMEENRPMEPDENEWTDRADEQESETAEGGNAGSWTDDYPSETVMAVEPTETNAGVQLTRYDLDELNGSIMLEIHEYYPPEDDVEGESIYVHGEYAVLQLQAAISELVSERFEEAPWDDF